MTKIGVKLEVENKWGQILFKLFQDILLIPSMWVKGSCHHEILFPEDVEENGKTDPHIAMLDEAKLLNNQQMNTYVSYPSYYPILATFSIYFSEQSYIEIRDVNHFLNSACDFVVSVVDTSEIYVLSKEESLIDKVVARYQQYGYSAHEVYYKENLPHPFPLN
ncbi:DUF2691 family protein [Oceanobacillus kapialis]|uniref:DUF2691 family protein n=1 Tax=Oceanobacillus kapialis TaxID=481353 RepID=A0ABW5PWH3_9BACI